MTMLDSTTVESLRDAFTIDVNQSVADRHTKEIASALQTFEPPPRVAAPRRSRVRRMAITALLAGAVVLPMGAAVATEDAMPGDILYPIKLMVEPFVAIVDAEVAATHRVEELSVLVGSGAGTDRINNAVHAARRELDALPFDHQLWVRFNTATDRLAVDVPEEPRPPSTDRDGTRQPDRDTSDPAFDDSAETTSPGDAEGAPVQERTEPPAESPPVTDTTIREEEPPPPGEERSGDEPRERDDPPAEGEPPADDRRAGSRGG